MHGAGDRSAVGGDLVVPAVRTIVLHVEEAGCVCVKLSFADFFVAAGR
jgi:hypothetical protein